MPHKETSVFSGHRDRMRKKLHSFGPRFFETYELLEMLLYSAIPRRNTNPTAKLLLENFSSLENIFSATPSELAKVPGIGTGCAEFIANVGYFINSSNGDEFFEKQRFSSGEDIGAFFRNYFKGKKENEIVILLLDSDFNYIDLVKVFSLDLSSGAVNAKPFIDAALKSNASVCAIAHNHPHSSAFPTDADRETDKMLKLAFKEAGLILFESYVVTNEGYKTFSNPFLSDKGETVTADSEFKSNAVFNSPLFKILSSVTKNAEDLYLNIINRFASRTELFEAGDEKLKSAAGCDKTAELIYLIAALASREKTEKFAFGKKHTEEEIKDFLKGFFLNSATESAVILPLDSSGKVMSLEILSDGTVNALNIIPRTILEKLAGCGSDSFILAHNHPGGIAEPSQEDISATDKLTASLENCGVHLKAHYVIAKNECTKI